MNGRRVTIAALLVAGTLSVTYLAGAALTYDQVSRIAPDCGGRFQGQEPDGWTAEGASRDWTSDLDAGPWRIPTWEDLLLPARDPGITLHAWWMPASDQPAGPLVVIVPGRGSCLRDPAVLLPAGMLWHAGIGVLAVEPRDHGGSTTEDGRYAGGTEEYRDVLAAIDWAEEHGYRGRPIGVTGVSMGAVTALIAAGADPRIDAVWSDSAYADIVTRIADELSQRGYPPILAAAGPLMGRLIAGDDFDTETPLKAIGRLGDRPLAIIHGGADARTYVQHAAELAAEAWRLRVPTEVWVEPDAGHGQMMFADPATYEERMVAFFRAAFSGS